MIVSMHKYGHGDNQLKCPNFSSSHLLSREYFPTENGGKFFPPKTVENIFPQKLLETIFRWKMFSTEQMNSLLVSACVSRFE